MTKAAAPLVSERNPASFRDPSGFVFHYAGRVFRAINGSFVQTCDSLIESGVLSGLIAGNLVVETWPVDDGELVAKFSKEHRGYSHFLEHQVIAPITYPYEWSVSMLADAGIHTIDLQVRLLSAGYSLKDATAYNIQFLDGRPVFIDVSSIDQPKRLDIWFGLGQFGQMFTFPLLLARHHGWDLRSYFLASLSGRTVEDVARGFGVFERLRPRSILDVTLPLMLKRVADGKHGAGRELLERPNPNYKVQVSSLQRLRKKVSRLAEGYRPRGTWSTYTATCTYDEAGEAAKKTVVKDFLQTVKPESVLDLGCNTGDYSIIAAENGAKVVAVDSDHDAIELMYRRLRGKLLSITPMVVDISNPSPAIGFRNRERDSFLRRMRADCTLALALLHHLVVSANLSVVAVRDLLLELTNKWLVLEFVPTDDPMFQRLIKYRENTFEYLTLDYVKSSFSERLELIREERVPGSGRSLLIFRRK
ncbi:MAG TPA: methyltransferase domain-containing protein [Blastocatellia bacterium]|nr:methyltransferase domain-containing protein [Blastocatellia bacterium]